MGGQACVLYGAAEFSRDTDIAVLQSPDNLARLRRALDDLRADVIAVPPFEASYLERGHAVHFRCAHPDAPGMRVDVMSRMRGVDPFEKLWERRTTFTLPELGDVDVLALPDLVAAKKTQRDKDWPMLRRLVDASYLRDRDEPTEARVEFWLGELRTAALLAECTTRFPDAAERVAAIRAATDAALRSDIAGIEQSLASEEAGERSSDRAYWAPLRDELEALRRAARGSAD
jgi:hypothetical protein